MGFLAAVKGDCCAGHVGVRLIRRKTIPPGQLVRAGYCSSEEGSYCPFVGVEVRWIREWHWTFQALQRVTKMVRIVNVDPNNLMQINNMLMSEGLTVGYPITPKHGKGSFQGERKSGRSR